MKKEPLGWRILAKVLARPSVSRRLIKFAQSRPYFDIYKDEKLYMRRWWLVPSFALAPHPKHGWLEVKPWWPFRWRIHHIVSADSDPHYHDHQSGYRTFILTGGYCEVSPSKISTRFPSLYSNMSAGQLRTFRAGSTASAKATAWHSISAVNPQTYTLFCMSTKQVHEWGFLVEGVKVHWRTYIQAQKMGSTKENKELPPEYKARLEALGKGYKQ